jgi:isoquinoline 1-oxidoreductase beta subunit
VNSIDNTALEVSNVSRRVFLRTMSAVGLVLAVGVPRRAAADDETKYGADSMLQGSVDNSLAFIAIGMDGAVTIVCHCSEMGQGVFTSLPMVVADELEVEWRHVRVRQANGEEERYGNEDTDPTRSRRHLFVALRRCAAAARTMLEQAGAARWGVPIGEVEAVNHEVLHRPTNRRIGYGKLAAAASRLPVPARATLRLKAPSMTIRSHVSTARRAASACV